VFDLRLTSERVFDHNDAMGRTQVRWGRVLTFMVGAVLAVSLVGSRAAARTDGTRPQRIYLVQPGDTVWGIASRHAGRAADPRPLVDRLIRVNHLRDALISPGQRLVLPSP
jgi:nucleoid-associated protein YgaU